MNRFWKFWKTYILAPSIPISALTVIITICMLDSDSCVPTVVCVINLLWLLMIIWRNDPERENKKRRSEDDFEDTQDCAR
jgi:hypothetical protein